jgi:hypothetical protein
MSTTARCPNCSKDVVVPPAAAGRKVRCPKCGSVSIVAIPLDDDDPPVLVAPPPDPPEQPVPLSLDDDPGADENGPPRAAPPPPPPRKVPWKRIGIGAGVCVLFVAVGLIARAVYRMRPPPVIPDAQWQTVEVSGYYKAQLPGPSITVPIKSDQTTLKMKICEPDPDSSYALGSGAWGRWESQPEQDAALGVMCTRMVEALVKEGGGHELNRERITLGPYRGMELVIRVPKVRGKAIVRVYFADDRMIMAIAAGPRLEPDHPNVRKLFDSLEITDSVTYGYALNPGNPPAVAPVREPIALRDLGPIGAVGFAPDRNALVVGGWRAAEWFDLRTRESVARQESGRNGPPGPALSGAVNRTGDRVAVAAGNRAYVYDRNARDPVALTARYELGGEVGFHPTEPWAVSSWCAWDLSTPQANSKSLGGQKAYTHVAFAPNGQLALGLSQWELALCHPQNMEPLATLTRDDVTARVTRFTVSPDATHAAARTANGIPLFSWTMVDGKPQQPGLRWIAHGKPVAALAFTPTNALALVTEDGELHLYSLPGVVPVGWGRVFPARDRTSNVAVGIHPNPNHPDGMLLAVAARDTVRIYDLNRLPKP